MTSINEGWTVSIGELVDIFRGTLISIIPWMERARIQWENGKSYDDWDEIISVLFKNIISNSLISQLDASIETAKYDYQYENYSHLNFIKVEHENVRDYLSAFLRFVNSNDTYDALELAVLDPQTYSVIEYITVPYNESTFYFISNIDGKKIILKEVKVIL